MTLTEIHLWCKSISFLLVRDQLWLPEPSQRKRSQLISAELHIKNTSVIMDRIFDKINVSIEQASLLSYLNVKCNTSQDPSKSCTKFSSFNRISFSRSNEDTWKTKVIMFNWPFTMYTQIQRGKSVTKFLIFADAPLYLVNTRILRILTAESFGCITIGDICNEVRVLVQRLKTAFFLFWTEYCRYTYLGWTEILHSADSSGSRFH